MEKLVHSVKFISEKFRRHSWTLAFTGGFTCPPRYCWHFNVWIAWDGDKILVEKLDIANNPAGY